MGYGHTCGLPRPLVGPSGPITVLMMSKATGVCLDLRPRGNLEHGAPSPTKGAVAALPGCLGLCPWSRGGVVCVYKHTGEPLPPLLLGWWALQGTREGAARWAGGTVMYRSVSPWPTLGQRFLHGCLGWALGPAVAQPLPDAVSSSLLYCDLEPARNPPLPQRPRL
jgi:hypothetical protein